MDENMLGTIALSKMLGARFVARRVTSMLGTVSVVVDLIEDKRVVWRLYVAKDVLARADIEDHTKPSAEQYVPEARALHARAVAGDEAVYLRGQLMEGA